MTPNTRAHGPEQSPDEEQGARELRSDTTAAESSRRIRKRKRSKPQPLANEDGSNEDEPADTERPTPRIYQCPFSHARPGSRRRCKEGPWKARRSVTPHRVYPLLICQMVRHLEVIRFGSREARKEQWNPSLPQPNNGDASHPADSSIWNSEVVLSCFRGSRPKVPLDTKIEKRRVRNNRFWQKRNAERKQLEEELKPLVDSKIITAEEYDQRIGKSTLGYYKHLHVAKVMKLKFEEAEAALKDAGQEAAVEVLKSCVSILGEIRTAVLPPATFDVDGNPMLEPARDANGQVLIAADGLPVPLNAEDETPLRPISVPIWARPSPRHYLQILCLILPLSDWPPNDPLNKRAHAQVVKILSASTTTYPAFDILGDRVSESEKTSILQSMNAAKDQIDQRVSEEVGFVDALKEEYQKVQEEVKNVLLPSHGRIPPLAYLRLLEVVDEVVKRM
jgi:hypothetical protein